METKTNPEKIKDITSEYLGYNTNYAFRNRDEYGEANFKELGKEQLEMEMDKEMKKEENKAMEDKEKKKIEKIINTEMEEKKKKT